MKIVKKILLGLLTLILLVFILGFFYLQSLKPTYSGEIDLDGLSNYTEVYFDDYGIPHIYAQNIEDLYYTFGYVHAQERLFQMEMMRRVGAGRLSEILGPDFVKTDKFFRTIGIKEKAEKDYKVFMSDTTTQEYKIIQSYLKGINYYINNNNRPIEFRLIGIPKEEFTAKDMFLASGYMAFSFAAGLKLDPLLTQINLKYGQKYIEDLALNHVPGTQTIPVYKNPLVNYSQLSNISYNTNEIMKSLPAPYFYGSNSWVISGKKTESGKVLFANDAHMKFAQPAVWYEAHLECPGFSLYGNFLGGIPFALIGHNRDAAWGITMLENDDTDFFIEEVNPENANMYKKNGKWRKMKIILETIKVKGSADVNFQIRKTFNGPIINDVLDAGDKPISLFWTYNKKPNKLLQAFYGLNNSHNIEDARKAASLIAAPGLNIMYGDVHGNYAWWGAASIIKYKQPVQTKMFIDASDKKNIPQGFYDFADNPFSENSPQGFIFSSNNQPAAVNGLFYPGYYAPESRAKRIVNILSKDSLWNIEKTNIMNTDVISNTAVSLSNTILSEIDQSVVNKSKTYKKAFSVLKKWNGNHLTTMTEPVIYYRLMRKVLEECMADELDEKEFELIISGHFMQKTLPVLLNNEKSVWWDNVLTKNKLETRSEIFTIAFVKAVDALIEEQGDDITDWKWGNVHTVEHQNPVGKMKPLNKFFNVGPFSTWGGTETINNLNFHLSDNGIYKVSYGPSMRIIIDFADIENSVSVIPTGQSGMFLSKHYNDQAELYNSGKYRKQMMNMQEIISTCKNKVIFK